jgi:hypothetical protein
VSVDSHYDCGHTMGLFRRKRHPLDEQVQRALAEGRISYECWYCTESIEETGFDPCAVIIVANWIDEENQREQQFFAHAECFRRSGSGSDLYVFEDVFPPKREPLE